MHLIVNGFAGDEALLDDIEHIRAFLEAMPGRLGMTAIDEVRVLRHEAAKGIDSGITGGVFIAESHISIHTFPRVGSAMIDIASCKPFNTDVALDACVRAFGFRVHTHRVVQRMLLPSLADAVSA